MRSGGRYGRPPIAGGGRGGSPPAPARSSGGGRRCAPGAAPPPLQVVAPRPYSVAPTSWLVPGGPSPPAEGDPQLLCVGGLDTAGRGANPGAPTPTGGD